MRPLASFIACTLACSTAARPGDEYLARVREEYAAVARLQRAQAWSSAIGEQDGAPLILAGHDRLFRETALHAVQAALRVPGGRSAGELQALRFFQLALTAEPVALATAPLDLQYARAEARAAVSVPWLPAKVAYRDLPAAVAREPDAQRRQQLYAAGTAVVATELNPILQRREAAAQQAAGQTSFGDYVALSEALRAVRLDPLLAQGVRYLTATAPLFEPLLDRVAREELGVGRAGLHLADLARLWQAPRLAQYFDPSLELETLRFFLGGIGLDLHTAAGTEVRVDDRVLALKPPRAFVEPVNAPADVRLSVKPAGGLDSYWTLFHEAGHAVHFANATVAPRELVTLGHGAPGEAFGELFRGAFADRGWLLRYRAFLVAHGRPAPGDAELAAVLRRTALLEMLHLRRYAFARIAFELRLHGRPEREIEPALAVIGERPRDLPGLFRALSSAAYGFPLTEAESQRYLVDVDDTFYAADYARAFALAGMLHEGLARRFGDDWYGDPAVGAFLKRELFAPGESLSAEEVAQRLGFAPRVDLARSVARARRLLAEADALERGPPLARREADARERPQ